MPPNPEPPTDRATMLERIIAEGTRRRRRRLAASGSMAALVFLAVATTVVLAGPGRDREDDLAVTDDPTTTSTTDEPTTTTTKPHGDTATTTTVPATAGTDPTTSTTESPSECRNSLDQRCGDFYWDYDPATFPNSPSVITRVSGAVHAVAGQPVTISYLMSDNDAQFRCATATYEGASSTEYHGGAGIPWGTCAVPSGCDMRGDRTMRYGPWDPPEPPATAPVEVENVVVWDAPGTYSVTVHYEAVNSCFYDNPANPDQEVFDGYDGITDMNYFVEVVAPS